MANKLYNLARESTSTTGTGSISLSGAVSGFLTFALAGVQDGDVVTYAIEEQARREIGRGTYTAATKTLSRDLVYNSTSGGAKLALGGGAQVFVTPSAYDLDLPTNVRVYGALVDGTTDDTTAFQTADAAGRTLYLPAGTTKLTSFVNSGFSGWIFSPRATLSDWSQANFYGGFLVDDDFLGGLPGGYGANIHRFIERAFIGAGAYSWGGTDNSGNTTFVTSSTGMGSGYLERSATCFSVSPNGGCGLVGATKVGDAYSWYGAAVWTDSQIVAAGAYRGYSQRIYQTSAGGTCGSTPPTHTTGTQSDGGVNWTYVQPTWQTAIGATGVAVSDVLDGLGGWASYFEAVRNSGKSSARGMELVTKNLGSLVVMTPYSAAADGQTVNLLLNGGGDAALGNGAPANASSAGIVVSGANASKVFEKGIIFRNGSVNGADVCAIALARTHKIGQYNTTGLGSYLSGDVSDTTKTVGLEMTDDLFAVKIRGTQRLGATNTGVDVTGTFSSSGAISAATTIELGHASDTTLSRVSAGLIAVEGLNVPLEGRANTFTAAQVINVTAAGATPLQVLGTDAGASGPSILVHHVSASPAVSDTVAQMTFSGLDSNGNQTNYAQFAGVILDPTDGSEDGRFVARTNVAGTLAARLFVENGAYMTGSTGTDKGAGSFNAQAVYDDGTLLTCAGVEHLKHGKVTTDKWDGFAPDAVIPAETVNGEIVLEQRIERKHRAAHEFKALLDGGFDPRDPEQYFAKLINDEGLPGMPNQSDWQHGSYSLGEIHSKLWLSLELLAGVVKAQHEELKALKAKVK